VRSLLDLEVSQVPVAIVDIETTGLYPGADRVVELSVVRSDPGRPPELVLDTLVNPERHVAATEIHGITDADVVGAPRFADIAGDFAKSLEGGVLAAYNVYFDVRFLESEFLRVGSEVELPHLCLMYLRPMLGLGRKCCLADACRAYGIPHPAAHVASSDALAGARMWAMYLEVMLSRDIRTFVDLASLRAYKFVDSFSLAPLDSLRTKGMSSGGPLKPRVHLPVGAEQQLVTSEMSSRRAVLREYWDSLTAAVADLEITESEMRDLNDKAKRFALTIEEQRGLHARVFAGALGKVLEDELITDAEWLGLRRLHDCLRQLGWAPGV